MHMSLSENTLWGLGVLSQRQREREREREGAAAALPPLWVLRWLRLAAGALRLPLFVGRLPWSPRVFAAAAALPRAASLRLAAGALRLVLGERSETSGWNSNTPFGGTRS